MFPSSSRVKLNRVALKDLVGVKLVPRRRRVPSALDDLTADAAETQNQVERRVVRSSSSSSGDDGPGVHKCVPQTEGPETEVTVAAAADCCGGTIKAKRRRQESRKEACHVETKQEGATTREYGKNTPPRPTGHAGSEGSLRRAVTPSCCVLCGDCKFVSPRKKTLGSNKGKRRTSMLDKDVEEVLGPRCDVMGAEICRDKKANLGCSITNGSLPSVPEWVNNSWNDTAKTDFSDQEETYSLASGDSQAVCSSYRSTVKENGLQEQPFGPRGKPTESDVDELESFTCQRVRPYCGKIQKISFSCARTYMAWPFYNTTRAGGTTACQAEIIHPSARTNNDSAMNGNPSGSPSRGTNDMIPNAPTEKGVGKNTEFTHCFTDAEEPPASPFSDVAAFSTPSQHGMESGINTGLVSSAPVNEPATDNSVSTLSPSALGLSDWEIATPVPSLFTHGGLSSLLATPPSVPLSLFPLLKVKGVELLEAHSASTSPMSSPKHFIRGVEKPLFHSEEAQMTSCCSSPPSSLVASYISDSFHSRESFLLLPQDNQWNYREILTERSPPHLKPYNMTNSISSSHMIKERGEEDTNTNEFLLPPLLSPVTSPHRHLRTRSLTWSHCCSKQEEDDDDEEEINASKPKILPGHDIPHVGEGDYQHEEKYLDRQQCEEIDGVSCKSLSLSSHCSAGGLNDGDDQTDCDDNKEQQGCRNSHKVPLAPILEAKLISSVSTQPSSSPSSDEGMSSSDEDEKLSPYEIMGSETDETKADAAGDTEPGILDELSAYELDILLVDVTQEDPELFENLPDKSLLKLGPTRVSEAPKSRPPRMDKASAKCNHRTPVFVNVHRGSPDIAEEKGSRPWRPQGSSNNPSNTGLASDKQSGNMVQSDVNNNHIGDGLERRNSPYNTPPLKTLRNGPWSTNPANTMDFRRQKSPAYCRKYFSESLSCGFKMCRFQHVPVEGDEKFCIERVSQFIKNTMCLQKAGAVFIGYYQNNPPGLYFSVPVFTSLLWALLKANMLSDVLSVLGVSLAYKIVPDHEFLLALFRVVREKGLMGFIHELMQLTLKMANEGLVLSMDWLECVKNSPELQHLLRPNSPTSVSANHNAPFPECLKLAHSIVEIELCTKQEDWRWMGKVFTYICQSSTHPNNVEQICGRIAIALLSESKDKLSLPFAAFAETVCPSEGEEPMIKSFLGRIGVSLMLRYHKTHQWAKGQRVVEVLCLSKISFSTLKGLFGNEDGASRCSLVTVATELFLLSGSVEGALNTLRENQWFLSSHSWPCEPADLDSRSHVLMRLAEKTSHRDTLEVLSNLPGIKESSDLINVSRHSPVFNSHLQVCVDRQILPVASDTVDFMFSKNLAVDQSVLHILLHKLGKQNLWLRAREVFRHSLSVGYYSSVSAPPGFMTLIVPCRLGEVELALTFEMFIAVNATAVLQLPENTTSCLSITLKRTQSGESEYLSAGSRLLSAACVPQPKLTVHYTAVNSSQEQVFTLDMSSARRWLRHNHLWASEVWTH
ncbi:uncharacterized protein topaz1 isoform X2 [Solea solea]|uniref:uncharacterized protein topaz1 isoform X2 n=1 Tax=Solea solea TaxID=90069 RepID=UPI00272B53D5|nr:uncharacterized protein topaz1 isoform X2 [Solea solea]